MPQPVLYNLSLAELEELMRAWGQQPFRAKQLYRQLYLNLTNDPAAMSDLPLPLRVRLHHEAQLDPLELVQSQQADDGLTRKALFRVSNGALIESVLMIYADRVTVCVSTQAGCAMGCDFCATGRMGLLRNLSCGEIVAQVLWACRELRAWQVKLAATPHTPIMSTGEADTQWWGSESGAFSERVTHQVNRVTNVVFMGMGEPFANYERWWAAVERLHDPNGFNLGARNMTVSTVGVVPGILRLAEAPLPINLAISLHAPDDQLRSTMMPINRRYPLAELLAATREYTERSGRRVSFEYVLLHGRNDHPYQAMALAKLLRGQSISKGPPLLCHVNLIPWNPVPGVPLSRSERSRVHEFQQILRDYGVACTIRIERGASIAAACGQLAGH
ncbi:radical SAM protein [Candidatus Viridilinea mediisalina]|uniref:Probable dual-specificity RNA methyltransferase RlmN n=1 Tax=Candidatus Viridilinea mediisalina TaxID=2024553 RepID=A0A2A6RL07_9CHLR|nr:radical SAM protein [Candidatus Viridilinea mediisalina]PDW03586.1 23S rRNA (adenine(2503)-C2)-methyltransferase [Candidatus Viridilinea mediisalina]